MRTSVEMDQALLIFRS